MTLCEIHTSKMYNMMEASPKRGRGQDREKQRDSQKNNNILDKSPTMIDRIHTDTCTLKNHTKYNKIVWLVVA